LLARAAAVAAAALVAGTLGVLPAAAVEPFSGPTSIVGSSCANGVGDGSGSDNGTVRGAIGCNAEADSPISVFWYQGIRTVKKSPYVGQVIATAWDGANYLYILFQQAKTVKIGRVSDSGSFVVPTVLSTTAAPYTSGDVVAANGKWWAVWHEMVGSQAELYQARTLLAVQHRTRITTNPVQDLEPRLAYSQGHVEMIWSRYTPDMGASDLWVAGSTGGGWASRLLTAVGTHNNMPDIAMAGSRIYLSWTRDGVVNSSQNTAGGWATRSFTVHGYNSRLAVSNGRIFISYEANDLGGRIYVVEYSAGSWTGSAITGGNAGNFGLYAANGRATSLYYSVNGMSARQQY
jgi:hypothetical protein